MPELSINSGIEFRNAQAEMQQFRQRLAVMAGFVLLLFGVLLLRFVYLQSVMHSHYDTLAEANRISIVPVAPNRGVIVDRKGVVLAHNYSAYTLEIAPSRVRDLERTIAELADVVDIQPRDRARFRKVVAESRSVDSVPIRTRLTDEEVARFAANRYRFPGVEIRARLFRQYPFGETASHVMLRIYDVGGRLTRTLVDRPLAHGVHQAQWDGRDEHGNPAASGVYFVRLEAGRVAQTQKMVLLK